MQAAAAGDLDSAWLSAEAVPADACAAASAEKLQQLACCVDADTAGHSELFAMSPQHDSIDPEHCAEHAELAGIQIAIELRYGDLSRAVKGKHCMLAGSAQQYWTAALGAEQASEHHACSCALSCTAVAASGLPKTAAAAAVQKRALQSAAAACRDDPV